MAPYFIFNHELISCVFSNLDQQYSCLGHGTPREIIVPGKQGIINKVCNNPDFKMFYLGFFMIIHSEYSPVLERYNAISPAVLTMAQEKEEFCRIYESYYILICKYGPIQFSPFPPFPPCGKGGKGELWHPRKFERAWKFYLILRAAVMTSSGQIDFQQFAVEEGYFDLVDLQEKVFFFAKVLHAEYCYCLQNLLDALCFHSRLMNCRIDYSTLKWYEALFPQLNLDL